MSILRNKKFMSDVIKLIKLTHSLKKRTQSEFENFLSNKFCIIFYTAKFVCKHFESSCW